MPNSSITSPRSAVVWVSGIYLCGHSYTAFALLRFGVEPPLPPLLSSRFFFLSPGGGLSGGPGGEPWSFKAQWGRHVAQQVNGQRQFARTRPVGRSQHL